MKSSMIHSMKSTINALTIVILLGSPAAIAQTDTNAQSDEQLLRNLIQQENEGKNVIKRTEDSIFVSGAYRRPMIGRAARKAEGSPKDRLNRSEERRVGKE